MSTSKARKQRINAEVHALIVECKSVPCARCGKRYPGVCMDFDHLPEFQKEFNIGSPSNWSSVSRVLKEIEKTQVVCSNCHRIITWERKYGSTVAYPPAQTFWQRLLTCLREGCIV